MKLTSFKVIKLAVIVICMLAAGICYSCSVKNRDIRPENMVMALESDSGFAVEERGGIEGPRYRNEPEGGAGAMSGGRGWRASACTGQCAGTGRYVGTGWHAAPERQPVRGRYAAPGGYIVRGRYASGIYPCMRSGVYAGRIWTSRRQQGI